MLLEVNEKEWNRYVKVSTTNSLFADLSFLKVTAASFNFDLSLYVWENEEKKAILGFSIFNKGKVVKAPTNFHNFFLVEDTVTTKEQKEEAFFQAMELLKRKFSSITLKLESNFGYINVYDRLGFRLDERYSYEKRLDDLQYSRNIARLIKKGTENNYTVAHAKSFEASFVEIWQSNSIYILGSSKAKYYQFFLSLYQNGFIDIFDVSKSEVYVASLMVIKDVEQKKVFTYLISIPNKIEFAEAQTMLYHHCMSYYKAEDYLFCDLCGANLPSVARYKAKFKGELKLYNIVSYQAGYRAKIKHYAKKQIVRLLFLLKSKVRNAQIL